MSIQVQMIAIMNDVSHQAVHRKVQVMNHPEMNDDVKVMMI